METQQVTNLTLPEVNALPRDASKSQWYTQPTEARRIADYICLDGIGAVRPEVPGWRVLEPSAGDGALVRQMERYISRTSFTCIDIDPRNVELLAEQGYSAWCNDFLEIEPSDLAWRFDLVLMNPPFEDGQAEEHIAHALNFAPRVVALAPLTTLEGVSRSSRLWRHVELTRMVVFAKRPRFGHVEHKGRKGGETAMALFDMTRAAPGKANALTMDGVRMEWWR